MNAWGRCDGDCIEMAKNNIKTHKNHNVEGKKVAHHKVNFKHGTWYYVVYFYPTHEENKMEMVAKSFKKVNGKLFLDHVLATAIYRH